ncbi:peptidase M48-like protein [Pseudonocardia sediminis]|uniref:Peptidase M48-like protein n=1 Tax=Pseudonocardia sediminis TaxID=1397368 RepID=A0A4Q7U7J6_PSEST|nr:ArdC-like ssDNA-binding domain-containing protein [Pseudonocardia sediminis]RZT75524.1 peptidase M48-like protein [Pseudonocardia sediminis]
MTTRTRNTRPRQTPEQRAARVAELTDKLNGAIAELTEGEQWTAMLRTAARFHRYSFRNTMLLLLQAEEREATISRVAGLHTWRAVGRRVRKGEKGYQILAPLRRKLGDEEAAKIGPEAYTGDGQPKKVVRGCKIVHVFDVEQTEGDELPDLPTPDALTGGDPAGLFDRLADLVSAEGYTIERNPEDGDTQGWTNYATAVVSVRPDVDDAQAAYVLAHELGHIRARHDERAISRAQRETEADSIAYVITAAHGLDSVTTSAPYVAGWSEGDTEVIAAAAEIVHREATRILAELEGDTDGPSEDPENADPENADPENTYPETAGPESAAAA